MISTPLRPPELQLEGAIIEIARKGPASLGDHRARGRVMDVSGPYSPDPDWFVRPLIGGYRITYERVDAHFLERPPTERVGWVSEVFVEHGRIYAYPWRDEITVVDPGVGQARLF